MLMICCNIVEIAQTGIARGIFPYGSEVREILDIIMKKALMYQIQHWRTGTKEPEADIHSSW